ncbi:MAG: isoaspartyl peptidase/L-asparaginase [candidate division Zixibacteria bacterium]|nr:isoaspartyl peptidase/L-asparaginase [candidate division Zixibacteria bacterium]
MSNCAIAIHGGAGTILRTSMTPEKEKAYLVGLKESLTAGYEILKGGGTSMDAVIASVVAMENNPLFNAGVGAVFTHDGGHEQDACICDGATKNVGAVAAVKRVKSPITLARLVLEKSPHVLLAGDGAEKFAVANGMELVADQSYFDTDFRRKQLEFALAKEKKDATAHTQLDHSDDNENSKMGTVGAVAVDEYGNVAAATSTGGMTNKRHGRIGDTPMIGAGTYADNKTCAVSATGVGEYIMRGMVSYDISALMEYKGLSLSEAADVVVMEKFFELGGSGGVIAIDRQGNIAMPFNCKGMYRGSMLADGTIELGIFDDRG